MIRHLRSAADLDATTATLILDTAGEMAALAGREVKKLPTLRGRTVVNRFYEDSTRTRISFEAAAKRLRASDGEGDADLAARIERFSATRLGGQKEAAHATGAPSASPTVPTGARSTRTWARSRPASPTMR